MRFLHYQITAQYSGKTVLYILKNKLFASSSLIKLNKKREGNLLNSKPCFVNQIVSYNDILSFRIDDCIDENVIKRNCDIKLNILYEDEDLLIIDKPAGLKVHQNGMSDEPTICDAVLNHLKYSCCFHAVNRLDRGTSGIMVIAKNGYTHCLLKNLLHSNMFKRVYIAVCEGKMPCQREDIFLSISRQESSSKRVVSPMGQKCHTRYEVMSYQNGLSLLKLTAFTGRTHQLRLHMSAIGHPIIGDTLYGSSKNSSIQRPALHSYRIILNHPLTGENLDIFCPPPDDMKRAFPFPAPQLLV